MKRCCGHEAVLMMMMMMKVRRVLDTPAVIDSCCGENMESYERFCARIQAEIPQRHNCSTATPRAAAPSAICFHTRPVLPPVLSEKQIQEMNEYKTRALQLEAKKQVYYKNNLLHQIQSILRTSETQKNHPDPSEHLTDAPQAQHNDSTTHPPAQLTADGDKPSFIFSRNSLVTPSAESLGLVRERPGEEKQTQEEVKTEEECLQNLLKRSREFIDKQQAWQGSKVISSKTVDTSLSPSANENDGSLKGAGFGLPCSTPCGPSLSQTSHSPLISPEPVLNPRPHCGRPRPVSAGSIFFTYPDNPSHQPSLTANGRPQEVRTNRMLLGVESVSCSDGHSRFHTLNENMSLVRRSETSPVEPELTSPLFRRRCHTLDSQTSSRHQIIDRSQERMPRFMAGITPRTPTRLSPSSPISRSFTHESPCSASVRSGFTPDSPSYFKLSCEMEENSFISTEMNYRRADEIQWQVDAEEPQRLLDVHHMSPIKGSEEGGRRLRDWGVLSPAAAEDGCELRAERYPVLSPMSSLSPGDRSSLHSVPSISLSSNSFDIPSPSRQTLIYTPDFNHSAGNNRSRLSLVMTGEQQRALCRLSAAVKGFLTRRLLHTERVKHLRQTVQDTQEFIASFSVCLSAQDFSLQERVRAQLRAALFDIHDIFFTITLEERLFLLQQDRDLLTERKIREMEKAKTSKDKLILSTATQKSLDRKKQRVTESPRQMRNVQKTKSSPAKRVLQPSQGQNALIQGQQFLRRGSYKKSAEERVQRSERLRKQNSLG